MNGSAGSAVRSASIWARSLAAAHPSPYASADFPRARPASWPAGRGRHGGHGHGQPGTWFAGTPPVGGLDRFFKISERGSTVRIEIVAGITTWLTMAYILFVNPAILGFAGVPTCSRSGCRSRRC